MIVQQDLFVIFKILMSQSLTARVRFPRHLQPITMGRTQRNSKVFE